LANIPRPRIANIGALNRKIDFALISEIANIRPDWHWVLIGRVHQSELSADMEEWRYGLDDCRALPNVHFLAERPRASIPAYLNHMDVNTICYRIHQNDWVVSGYPVKLNEYLAVGKPIVAAAQEAIVQYFSSVVDVARNKEEWLAAIERALAGGVGTPEQRRAVALENSWETRVDLLERWLLDLGT
jgi:glycosyltransferase involved in cell wall biosynthesis